MNTMTFEKTDSAETLVISKGRLVFCKTRHDVRVWIMSRQAVQS